MVGSRVRPRIVAGVCLLACSAWGQAAEGPAQSQLATESIRVDFDGPRECGDEGTFFEAVRTRTTRVRPSNGDPHDRRFVVRITRSESGYDGRLTVVDAGDTASAASESAERRIGAAGCAEVFEALSIIAALAVDANAGGGTTSSTPGLAAAVASSGATVAPPLPPGEKAPHVAPNPPAAAEAIPTRPLPLSWFVGAASGVDVLEPGSHVFPFVGLTFDVTWERASVLSPSLRASARYSFEQTVTSVSGQAAFTLATLRIEPCPVQLILGRSVRLLPCAVVDGGVLFAQGRGVSRQQSHSRPWWTVGAGLRLSMLPGGFRVDVEAGAFFPLNTDTFQFLPDETIYRVSGMAPFLTFGVSLGKVAKAPGER
jgi:hypothetical protein